MSDKNVSKKREKVFPRERPPLTLEVVTKYRAASDPFTSATPRCNGGGARLVPISLPRVKWLERPDV